MLAAYEDMLTATSELSENVESAISSLPDFDDEYIPIELCWNRELRMLTAVALSIWRATWARVNVQPSIVNAPFPTTTEPDGSSITEPRQMMSMLFVESISIWLLIVNVPGQIVMDSDIFRGIASVQPAFSWALENAAMANMMRMYDIIPADFHCIVAPSTY